MKFFNLYAHFFIWIGFFIVGLVLAEIIHYFLNIPFDTALLIIGFAVLLDIQMEVDGLAKIRRDIGKVIKRRMSKSETTDNETTE